MLLKNTAPPCWGSSVGMLAVVRRFDFEKMNKRRQQYYQYLESEHWRRLRLEAFERDGFKCLNCGTNKNLRGHHKRYRKDLRLCTVKDIETLCQKCHDNFHREKARLRKERRKLRNQFSHLANLLCGFSAEDSPSAKLIA